MFFQQCKKDFNTFTYVSHVFSSWEYPSHLTKCTCSHGLLSEGPLAIIDSISQPASSALIPTTCFFGSVPRYPSNNTMLKVGWIFQDSGNFMIQYLPLIPVATTSKGPYILSSNFVQRCLARIFLPLSITSSHFL